MKAIDFWRPATMYPGSCSHGETDDLRERARTDVALIVVAAMTVALYAAMFLGIYRWVRYDPILPPDSLSTTEQLGPWSR
jgi:hypothetical protein